MGIGLFLKERRLELGYSLRHLANQVSIDVAYLSRIEAEKVEPSKTATIRLAAALGLKEAETSLMAGRLPDSVAKNVVANETKRSIVADTLEALLPDRARVLSIRRDPNQKAIESDFPIEIVSQLAEAESWRKEIFRPIYHIHKWWAQRLGSVFRAILVGTLTPNGVPIETLLDKPVRFPDSVVFDPFMGSGTTVGEALKLGCTVVGRDINPVAYRAVKTALGPLDRTEIRREFARLRSSVGERMLKYYVGRDSEGREARVLYYFWVKQLPCIECGEKIDLFSSYVFARHADGIRHPRVQILCRGCWSVFSADQTEPSVRCPSCDLSFDPDGAPVLRGKVICGKCGATSTPLHLAKAHGRIPDHRMYAKLLLREDGSKQYLATTTFDRELFLKAQREYLQKQPPVPKVHIMDGHNTKQILNYGYRYWHELFNPRQLLSLSMLGEAVHGIASAETRDAFLMLFSSTLEFNNQFVSFKGEGTGAVRHMFSHHILKPERTPIEPNIWGTEKSSGSFSSLFKSRLLRALDYKDTPFEIAKDPDGSTRKIFGLSDPVNANLVSDADELSRHPGAAYLSCGSSDKIDLADFSVDAIVTDPPFFDNVHYSELADFFYVWQELYQDRPLDAPVTTRRSEDVQDTDSAAFARKLGAVLEECARVLKNDGLLVFTYHHSRDEGWAAVSDALLRCGFFITACHPVKSEMSIAQPKLQAKEPIDLDVILVCRKQIHRAPAAETGDESISLAYIRSKALNERFNKMGKHLSRNDIRVVFISCLLRELHVSNNAHALDGLLITEQCKQMINQLFVDQVVESRARAAKTATFQPSLF